MKSGISLKSMGNAPTDLNRYSGRWVAFIDNKPVVSDINLSVLMSKVKKIHSKKKPSIMLVPRKDEGPYILII